MVCPHCKQESRDGEACEWCGKPLEVAAAEVAPAPAKPPTVQELEAVNATDAPVPRPSEPVTGIGDALVVPRPFAERLADYGIDRDTAPILLLILFHVVVSLARGGFSLYSLPIVLWLAVAAGVTVRQSWSMALAMVLICVEIAFALFGIGPHPRLGLTSWTPLDFTMLVVRVVTALLIVRLRDQFE